VFSVYFLLNIFIFRKQQVCAHTYITCTYTLNFHGNSLSYVVGIRTILEYLQDYSNEFTDLFNNKYDFKLKFHNEYSSL